MKTRRKIHTAILKRAGITMKVIVPITVEFMRIDDKYEEVVSAKEWQKVERAVERAWPGWYHRILKGGKHAANCKACKEGQFSRPRHEPG